MAQNLNEYLKGKTSKGFTPGPHYHRRGDFVSCFFRNDRCFAERVDDLLTVYLSLDNHELVGCKIKGVRHILETAGNFGVSVADEKVSLGFLFFAGAVMAKEPEHQERYRELARLTKDAALDQEELQPALSD